MQWGLSEAEKEFVVRKALDGQFQQKFFVCGKGYRKKDILRAFKDDPVWDVKDFLDTVIFRERTVEKECERRYEQGIFLLVHYILKHSWRLSQTNATIVLYGGFARAAMGANIRARHSLTVLYGILKRKGMCRDLRDLIVKGLFYSRFNDASWFDVDVSFDGVASSLVSHKVRDLDLLVTYAGRHRPTENEYGRDARILRNILGTQLRLRTDYNYDPYIGPGREIDTNFHRKGQRSHIAGDFYTYLISYTSKQVDGKYISRQAPSIDLDVTTMIENDFLDADVNNLVFYFDFAKRDFRFALRKQTRVQEVDSATGRPNPKRPLTLNDVMNNVANKKFITFPPNATIGMREWGRLKSRWTELERRGWKRNDAFRQVDCSIVEKAILARQQYK